MLFIIYPAAETSQPTPMPPYERAGQKEDDGNIRTVSPDKQIQKAGSRKAKSARLGRMKARQVKTGSLYGTGFRAF